MRALFVCLKPFQDWFVVYQKVPIFPGLLKALQTVLFLCESKSSHCPWHFLEIRSVFWLYLHNKLEFFNEILQLWSKFHQKHFTSIYLKSETPAHRQLRDYFFMHIIYKFSSFMVSVGKSHREYLFINGSTENVINVVTWLFVEILSCVQLLTRIVDLETSYKDDICT